MNDGARAPRSDPSTVNRPDLGIAAQCVELSQLAYADSERGARVALRSGYDRYQYIDSRGGRDVAIIVSDTRAHFVAFRGSDELRDWLTNFAIWRTRSSHGWVHSGYYRTYTALQDTLAEALTRLPPLPLVFTGHSMGGALAALSGLETDLQANAERSIYSFGQPIIGGRSFARQVRERTDVRYFRFIHGADAIAVWGLSKNIIAGTPCYFDYRGRLVVNRASGSLPKLSLHFHRMAQYRYLLRLNQLKDQSNREDLDVTQVER